MFLYMEAGNKYEILLAMEDSQVEENQLYDAESGKGWHAQGQEC